MRLGVDVTYSAVTGSSPNCVVTFKVYTENKFAYSDTQTLTYGGTAGITGTFNFTNSSTTGQQVLRDTKTWTYTYPTSGVGVIKTFSATLSGAFNNVTPTVTVNATTPNRGTAPGVVTELHVERVSDTQGIVTWNNPGGPITTNTVMRQEYAMNGVWADITPPFTSNAPIETLTSNSLRPNMLFRFQVLATNAVGSSRYATSNIIFTTPNAPGNVQAARQANGSVTLTWGITHPPTNQTQATTRYTQRIERSPDGTAWSVVNPQFIPSAGGTQTWSDASPSRGAMQYRVITITPDGLESAPGVSNNVASNYIIFGGSQKAAKIYAGSTLASKIYQGSVLVWEAAPPPGPPAYPEVHAQDDGLRMMIWDAKGFDLRNGGPYVLYVVTSPMFRAQAQSTPTAGVFWVDYENTNLMVTDPSGTRMTYGMTVAASERPWCILTWDGVNARLVVS